MNNSYISSIRLQKNGAVSRNSNLNARTLSRSGLGPISNALFMAVILTLMGLLYLSQVTKTNDLSFQISELENQKESLIEQNQELTFEAARLTSIERIEGSDVAAGLQEPSAVEFVR